MLGKKRKNLWQRADAWARTYINNWPITLADVRNGVMAGYRMRQGDERRRRK